MLVYDIDIREYEYGKYVNILSVVFQDFKLISLSLRKNIEIGHEDDNKGYTIKKR